MLFISPLGVCRHDIKERERKHVYEAIMTNKLAYYDIQQAGFNVTNTFGAMFSAPLSLTYPFKAGDRHMCTNTCIKMLIFEYLKCEYFV